MYLPWSSWRDGWASGRGLGLIVGVMLSLAPAAQGWANALKVQLLPVQSVQGQLRLRPDGEKIRYEYDQNSRHHLRLVAAVEDAAGLPVRGLTLGQIAILLDGKYVPLSSEELAISPVYAGDQGLTLTLVVDTSASMYGAPIADCRRLAAALVDQLQPRDALAVVRYADSATAFRKHTADKSVLRVFAGALEADLKSSGSALADALQKALDSMPSAAERKAVVLLGDGENTSSVATVDSVILAAHAAACPIFVVGIGQREVKGDLLQRLATETGGARLKPTVSAAELMAKLRRSVCPHYLIQVQTDKLPADGQSHQIELRIERETDSGLSQPVTLVTGVSNAQAWTTAAWLLMPILLVTLSGAALFMLTRRSRSVHGGYGDSPSAGPVRLCPVCRKAMPAGQSTCPSCGFEAGQVISMDDSRK